MSGENLDLNLLAVLQALLEEQSTTRAAQRLNVSQPTVSFALKKLRHFFKDDLFVRSGVKMQPTPLAESIALPIQNITTSIQRDLLRDWSFDPQTTERTFTLSVADIGELVFLPLLLQELALRAPYARLRSLSLPPSTLPEAMASGPVDIALGFFPELNGANFFQQGLYQHPYTCLVSKDHPTIGSTLSLDEFWNAQHVVVSDINRHRDLLENQMNSMPKGRKVALETSNYMGIPEIVASSPYIAIVPRAVGQVSTRAANVRMLEPPMQLPLIDVKQFWHSRVHKDAGIIWFRNLIREIFLHNDPSASGAGELFLPLED